MSRTTIALNALLLIGILYKYHDDPPLNARGWFWLGCFLACPALNLLGLSRIRGLAILAAVSNGTSILVWGGLIGLMMVWPLGNKPKTLQLLALVTSWLVLVLTEVVLVRMAREPSQN